MELGAPGGQSIAVWLAAAVVAHDLRAVPPLRAGGPGAGRTSRPANRRLVASAHRKVPRAQPHSGARPGGAGLTLLIFLPGIIEQGAPTYQAATGQTQEPFLGRWLLLTAAMFGISAVAYATRRGRLRAGDTDHSLNTNVQFPRPTRGCASAT